MTPEFFGFDIETRGRPDLVERYSSKFADFDATAIKCGNLKDPAKIAAKIEDARANHEADRVTYWANLKEKAALNPFTGEIVIIGLVDWLGAVSFLEGDEKTVLQLFWFHFTKHANAGRKFVFWSGSGSSSKMFDLDFIVTRSRIRGVAVPPIVRQGRFYSSRFVDLASEFLLYQSDQYMSLTRAADILGLYDVPAYQTDPIPIFRKSGDDAVSGENFAEFYEGRVPQMPKEEQRSLALKYLTNDVLHLLYLAPRIL